MQPIRDLSDITHRPVNLMGYAACGPGSILFESSGLRRFTHPTHLLIGYDAAQSTSLNSEPQPLIRRVSAPASFMPFQTPVAMLS